jgi:VanZ family protein
MVTEHSVRAAGAIPDGSGPAGRLPRDTRIAWLRTRGMLALLLILVIFSFILPAVVPLGTPWRLATDVSLTLIVIAGIVAIADHHKLAVALTAVGVLVVAARWSEWIAPTGLHPSVRDLLTLCALAMLAFAVGINVFGSGHALRDRIFGAIALYLLLGLMWALVYAVVDLFAPGAFAGRSQTDQGATDWVYFSFVTLTTVGYGDIVPVSRIVRSLCILEALVGQLYPAVIIARLVSLEFSQQPDSTPPQSD